MPLALEQLIEAFHHADAIPAIRALYDLIDRHAHSEISAAKLGALPDVRKLIDEIKSLATSRDVPATPDASIVIPVHNKLIYTLCCLKAVLSSDATCSFEIILADDASDDATPAVLSSIGGLVGYCRNPENLGFLRTCNMAAAQASGEILVLLNNDTLVLPGWLDELVSTLQSDRSTGLVGSKLVNADGSLQEAGGIVWSDGSASNFGRGQDATAPQFNYVKEVDYVSATSIAVPKNVWDKLGGFDELFAPGYYEDADLAFRVRAKGLRVVYQPFSAAVHFDATGYGRYPSIRVAARQTHESRVFFQRWKATLEQESLTPGANVIVARDRSRTRPRILFIDRYIPQPERDAGSRSVQDYLMLFKKAGFHVMLWPQNMQFERRYAAALQRRGIEVLYKLNQHARFEDWLRTHGPKLDYVFLSRAKVAVQFIDAVRRHTKAKILFYGHDIHFLRLAKEFQLTGNTAIKKEMRSSEKIERKVWSKCDVIYYPSHEECDFVRAEHPNKNVNVIPLFLYEANELVETRQRVLRSGIPASPQLLFVGGFRHRPNVDGILWFMDEVWPLILAAIPSCRLVIAGSSPPPEVLALANSKVLVTREVSDNELNDLYTSAQVAIAPLRFGGGLKGKIIEALAHAVPVVTTSVGIQGIAEMRKYVEVCDTPTGFAATVIDIARDSSAHIAKVFGGLALVGAVASEACAHSVLGADVAELTKIMDGK